MNYIKYNIKEDIHNLKDSEPFSNYKKSTTKIMSILPPWLLKKYKTPRDLVYCRYVRVSDDFLWVVFGMDKVERDQLHKFVSNENVTDYEVEAFLNAMII